VQFSSCHEHHISLIPVVSECLVMRREGSCRQRHAQLIEACQQRLALVPKDCLLSIDLPACSRVSNACSLQYCHPAAGMQCFLVRTGLPAAQAAPWAQYDLAATLSRARSHRPAMSETSILSRYSSCMLLVMEIMPLSIAALVQQFMKQGSPIM